MAMKSVELEKLLKDIKSRGINLKLDETGKGDNYITIETNDYDARIGANELGFWLESYKEKYKRVR